MGQIAQPLLSGAVLHLEEMHGKLAAWDKASRDWDPDSYSRSAIEPHDQDGYPHAVDVLIDVARDALEWLAANSPVLTCAWIERLVTSSAPLLRRLAIHAITVHPLQSSDESLEWLLDRVGLHAFSEHHEIHRAVALNYVTAAEPARKALVDAILAHTVPAFENWPSEKGTARSHFDWLSWLLQAKPDCTLANAALAPIKKDYPDWLPSDHPDLTHWTGSADWVGSESPWSVEQLLSREPREQLDDLTNFKGNSSNGPSREGLLANAREACKQNTGWALLLGQSLAHQAMWSSDLWPALIRGLGDSQLPVEGWHELLTLVSHQSLLFAHPYDVANLLYAIVRDGGKAFALDLLEQTNDVALPLWRATQENTEDKEIDDWLTRAINRPAGILVEFWINGLSLLLHGKTRAERVMPETYCNWFTVVVGDATSKGGMGRSLLASQVGFLFDLNDVWTLQHIIPLFSDPNPQKFAQAWDGFLAWGRLNPALVDALAPAFVAAIPRLEVDLQRRRQQFIEHYTGLAAFQVSDPAQQVLPALFQHGNLDDRLTFASHLGYFLRQMQEPAKQKLWNNWLRRYWQDRLQGVLAALDETEIRKMLEWLPHLGDAFPEAVALAVRSPKVRIEHSRTLHDLRESELVTRFPTETAELLTYLAGCTAGYGADNLSRIAVRLSVIPAHIRCRLDEALALAGVMSA